MELNYKESDYSESNQLDWTEIELDMEISSDFQPVIKGFYCEAAAESVEFASTLHYQWMHPLSENSAVSYQPRGNPCINSSVNKMKWWLEMLILYLTL